MALKTRQNPETGDLEVQVGEDWVLFEEYRKRQIDSAYQNSIKFLRDRLGEESAARPEESASPPENNS
ncbi:MAG: hypothetical protein IPM66_05270 [Acidobacteriota bacterium]|nr:MAG: hypothetical protein IPM66_05270 [Acidobacteriota bacterium]